jgi:hypothetical protein
MDAGLIQTVVAVGVPALGGVVWLVKLEARQDRHEAECLQRQRNLDERHKAITDTLAHIDRKLDRLMGMAE